MLKNRKIKRIFSIFLSLGIISTIICSVPMFSHYYWDNIYLEPTDLIGNSKNEIYTVGTEDYSYLYNDIYWGIYKCDPDNSYIIESEINYINNEYLLFDFNNEYFFNLYELSTINYSCFYNIAPGINSRKEFPINDFLGNVLSLNKGELIISSGHGSKNGNETYIYNYFYNDLKFEIWISTFFANESDFRIIVYLDYEYKVSVFNFNKQKNKQKKIEDYLNIY